MNIIKHKPAKFIINQLHNEIACTATSSTGEISYDGSKLFDNVEVSFVETVEEVNRYMKLPLLEDMKCPLE